MEGVESRAVERCNTSDLIVPMHPSKRYGPAAASGTTQFFLLVLEVCADVIVRSKAPKTERTYVQTNLEFRSSIHFEYTMGILIE